MVGNLFWGNHLRYFGDKISLNGRPSPISLISRQNNAKHYCHYFDCDSRCESATNQAQNCNISSLRGSGEATTKQSIKNSPSLAEGARGCVKPTSSLRENERSEFSWQSKQNKSARSANPLKSFCYFLLLQKAESPLNLVIARRIVDSHKAIQKIWEILK